MAYRELAKALQIHTEQDNAGFNALEIAGYFGIVCYYASVYFADTDTVKFMVMICGVMAILCVYVVTFPRFHAGQVTAACLYLYDQRVFQWGRRIYGLADINQLLGM